MPHWSSISRPINFGGSGVIIRDMRIESSYKAVTEVDIRIAAVDPSAVDYFMRLMTNDLPGGNTMGLHILENEWMCVWCGSPNPISNRHCGKCGGARGFIISR